MIEGEGEASPAWMTHGAWIDYAKRFGALCFSVEHRYYGKSRPAKDLSTENLQYLTSQQALADLAAFIVAMNKKYDLPKSTKWIAFGGSYPGSLSAWLRLKYPHLVHGAMSASSPLLAQVEYSDYFRVSVESLRTYSNECVNEIEQATSEFQHLLQNKNEQININNKFQLCTSVEDSLKIPDDITTLYFTLTAYFGMTVQHNNNNIGFLQSSKVGNITIDTLCDIMTNNLLGSSLDRLVAVNTLMLNAFDKKCLDYKHDGILDFYKNANWTPSNVSVGSIIAMPYGRQWLYQSCNEFGFFHTTSSTKQVFGNVPLEFFTQECADVFGGKYNLAFINKAINRTNTIYGGLDIDVTNVVFVHGSLDPWRAAGITKTIKKGAPVIFIEGTSHMANMFPESDSDLPQLKAAREEVAKYVGAWIRE